MMEVVFLLSRTVDSTFHYTNLPILVPSASCYV